MSDFNVLDQILSDFKVPRRNLKLDEPTHLENIGQNRNKIIDNVLTNDYLAFTRNLKIEKANPLTDEERLNKDDTVNKVYNFDYRSDSSSNKSDYDLLKEGYELLYAVYLEQKRNINNIVTDYMKLAVEYSYTKENIEETLSKLTKFIDENRGTDLIFQLEQSASKINVDDLKYIEKLKKVIGSSLLNDEQKREILDKLLE